MSDQRFFALVFLGLFVTVWPDSGDCEPAVLLQPSGASARVSRAPGDSSADSVGIVRPLCVDSAGVSRAPCDSPADFDGAGRGQPLCVASGDAPRCAALRWSGSGALATASENKGIIGLLEVSESDFHLFRIHLILLIHVLGRRHLHVHVFLALLVLVLLLVFALLRHLLRSLLLLHMRMRRFCTVLAIRGRTRLGYRVPRAQRGSKVGFPVRPKICVLSQRWQVAGSIPRKQPGTGTMCVKEGAGHTFPPPGGSWYPIRVTWIRIGHQAIDGLDEGVEPHCRGFGC